MRPKGNNCMNCRSQKLYNLGLLNSPMDEKFTNKLTPFKPDNSNQTTPYGVRVQIFTFLV